MSISSDLLFVVGAVNGDSPAQEPQSTSCDDDPPDSSTACISLRSTSSSSSNVPLLRQLLADSDSEDQSEVSTCQPETTTGNEPHVLLKV